MRTIQHLVEQLIELDFPAAEQIDINQCEDGSFSAMVHLADGNAVSASLDLSEMRENIAAGISAARALHSALNL